MFENENYNNVRLHAEEELPKKPCGCDGMHCSITYFKSLFWIIPRTYNQALLE